VIFFLKKFESFLVAQAAKRGNTSNGATHGVLLADWVNARRLLFHSHSWLQIWWVILMDSVSTWHLKSFLIFDSEWMKA
jgi:hypothetical protein